MPINNFHFTIEETNLIKIYKADTATATVERIIAACEDIMDEDIITIAENASYKLAALTDAEFSALSFIPADETEAEPDETNGQNVTGGPNTTAPTAPDKRDAYV